MFVKKLCVFLVFYYHFYKRILKKMSGTSSLNHNITRESKSGSVIEHLQELPLNLGNKNVSIDQVEYTKNRFILSDRNDYNRLRLACNIWLVENELKSSEDYQNWVNEMRFNFYEGFDDSMETLKMKCIGDGSSGTEDSPNLSDYSIKKLSTDLNLINENVIETISNHDYPQNSKNFNNDEFQNENYTNSDCKKKYKKRRTRKDKLLKKLQLNIPDNLTTISDSVIQQNQKLETNLGSYIGQVKNGLMHGTGHLLQKDGSWYKGSFYNNLKSGYGEERLVESGKWYKGHFDKGLYNSYGQYKDSNTGVHYKGNFLNGNFSNKGEYKDNDGKWYKGNFVNAKFEGYGECKFGNGSFYKGYWKEGEMCGSGEWRDIDGSLFAGEWKLGQMHGEIEYIWADGSGYKANYINGKKYGEGEYKSSNGTWYKPSGAKAIKSTN